MVVLGSSIMSMCYSAVLAVVLVFVVHVKPKDKFKTEKKMYGVTTAQYWNVWTLTVLVRTLVKTGYYIGANLAADIGPMSEVQI